MRARLPNLLLLCLALVCPCSALGAPNEATPAATDRNDDGYGYWGPPVVSISLGAEWTNGGFGLPLETDTLGVPIGLRYEHGPFMARVSTTFLSVRGPQGVFRGGIVVTERRTQSDMGDVVVGASFTPNLIEAWAGALLRWPFLEFGLDVKIPTASESKLLGTGEFDYTLRADVAHRFGALTPFFSVGYRIAPGSLSVSDGTNDIRFELRNSWNTSLGFSLELPGPRASAGLAYDFFEAQTGGGNDAHELVPYLNVVVGPVSAGPYLLIGLSKGSPDFGAGLQLTLRLSLDRFAR